MKKIFTLITCSIMLIASCSNSDDDANEKGGKKDNTELTAEERSKQNVEHAMELIDNAIDSYFTGAGMTMSRYYNPYTGSRSDEVGSVWMYTSSIEAVNAVLHALEKQKEKGITELYDANWDKYKELLSKLYSNADYYLGTYTLTSFTQTKEWTVYGVNRGRDKGTAEVEGVLNVYDDQMWFIRECLDAYKATGEKQYLEKAEYLTQYVLDGWDCTLNANGNQNGGITWGPGYTTKHSCSNGPIVSPLVWLHELYKDKSDEITYRYIAQDKARLTKTEKKADYYLNMAKAVYDWQKSHLLTSDGVYDDMMGGCSPNCDVAYEEVNGVRYRKNTELRDRVGPAISYNSGTMLSGAADLYRATGDATYKDDLANLSEKSFNYFAKYEAFKPGHYSFDISGFNDWFNGVLMRGYVDSYSVHTTNADYINAYQDNLDYAYDNYLYKHMLPTNLLVGWSREQGHNKVEGMFTFTFAAEYAVLAQYELQKK